MGYESNVRIACNEKAFSLFQKAYKTLPPDKIYFSPETGYYFLSWNNIYWYTGIESVDNIKKSMAAIENESVPEFLGMEFKFIRMGEEEGDIEIRMSSECMVHPDYTYVRDVNIPDDAFPCRRIAKDR